MPLSIRQKGLLLVAAPLAIELLLLTVLGILLHNSSKTAARIDHYRAIISTTNALHKQFVDAGSLLIFYSISHKTALLDRFDRVSADIGAGLSELTDAASTDPRHRLALHRVCILGNEAAELLDTTREKVKEPGWFTSFSKSPLPDQLMSITGDCFGATHDLVAEIQRTEKLSPRELQRMTELEFLVLSAGAAVCLVFILFAWGFYKQISSRLQILEDNTLSFARGEPLRPVLGGDDEIGRLDRTFHDMSTTIEEAAEFRKQIISTVSHEIRTPLSSLKMFLDMLCEGVHGELSPDAQLRSNLALGETDRLIRLLNDLLAAESMRARGFSIEKKEVELKSLVNAAMNSVGHLCERNNVNLVDQVESCSLTADGDRILQVLTNFLSNAIKFSRPGGSICIKSKRDKTMLTLLVVDSGRGVPPELTEKIFERHVQVKESDRRKEGGVGLGLAICKAIIEQHDGRIGCYNNDLEGATFWFSLPLGSSTESDTIG